MSKLQLEMREIHEWADQLDPAAVAVANPQVRVTGESDRGGRRVVMDTASVNETVADIHVAETAGNTREVEGSISFARRLGRPAAVSAVVSGPMQGENIYGTTVRFNGRELGLPVTLGRLAAGVIIRAAKRRVERSISEPAAKR